MIQNNLCSIIAAGAETIYLLVTFTNKREYSKSYLQCSYIIPIQCEILNEIYSRKNMKCIVEKIHS